MPEKSDKEVEEKAESDLSSSEDEGEFMADHDKIMDKRRPQQRAPVNRMANRMRNRRQQREVDSDEDEGQNQGELFDDEFVEEDDDGQVPKAGKRKMNFDPNKKMTKKEMIRMQRKQERQQQMEAIQQQRDQDQQQKEQSESLAQEREEQERLREEEERAAEEEAERQKKIEEQKEFDKWSTMFSIDAQGNQAQDDKEYEVTLQKFIDYITLRKVVMFEDLASEFNMQTKDAVDRVQKLLESGRLLGITDDRGKFIHINEQEFKSVSNYMKAKGRINRVDLMTECNRLVRMGPTPQDKIKIQQEQKALLDNVEKQFDTEETQ